MTAPLLLASILAAVLLQLAVATGLLVLRLARIRTSPGEAEDNKAAVPESGAWTGWRDFFIERDVFEDPSRAQWSLHLRPVDDKPLPAFLPGQYLTFSLDVASPGTGAKRSLVRCYSLSDQPNPKTYRISVKRVPAPPGRMNLPPGAASTFLHDTVKVGDILKVKAPAGQFVLDVQSDVPAVFIAGGVGVTPMISMISWSLTHQPARRLSLFYGVDGSVDHAFKADLSQLAAIHPALQLVVVYRLPGPCDVEGEDFQQSGLIDLALLRRILPHGRHVFYVCGPPAMMAALIQGLAEWGIAKSDIHFESFGPPSFGDVRVAGKNTAFWGSKALDIRFQMSRRTISWTGEDLNLLAFSERHSIPVEAGCRTGNCGSCETRIISGDVRYEHQPNFRVAAGSCLLCVVTPVSNLVLEA